MRISVTIAAAALLAACSQSTPPEPVAAPAPTISAAETGPCTTGFVEIAVGTPACGVALQADGSLSIGDRRTPLVVVSYQDGAQGRTAVTAKEIVLFPPAPRSGLRILQVLRRCGGGQLCWAVRIVDPKTATLHDVTAGKYGPSHWIRWSPDERRVALISRNEGAEWLHVVDAASGATTTYPDETEAANWKIDRESLAWTDGSRFTVKIKACESCAFETRSFTLP